MAHQPLDLDTGSGSLDLIELTTSHSSPPPDVTFMCPPTYSDFNQSDNEFAPLLKMDLIEGDMCEEKRVNKFPEDHDFSVLVQEAENAIDEGVLPELIAQGSSGSYFVRNLEGDIVAVFKPRNEEPYGQMNPKLMKWIQKCCCPCCFGRGCLIPNQGYLSEAGASIVDRKLQLGVVPKTAVVYLASDSFYYSRLERAKSKYKREILEKNPKLGKKFKRIGLPLKIGSFQTFVKDHKDADYYLRVFASDGLSDAMEKKFRSEFERMVIVDYIIRNTDRGNNNWLIKYKCRNSSVQSSPRKSSGDTAEGDLISLVDQFEESLKISAIDNGLAFPFKHPDSWRTYPYHWAWLAQSKSQFSDEIRDLVLPLISDMNFVQELCDELEDCFRIDKAFDKKLFERQMSVMRGQILNLAQALREKKSPLQLVQMPLSVVERADQRGHDPRPAGAIAGHTRQRIRIFSDSFSQSFHKKKPFFSWC